VSDFTFYIRPRQGAAVAAALALVPAAVVAPYVKPLAADHHAAHAAGLFHFAVLPDGLDFPVATGMLLT
jgi:hypothetical protein